LIGVAQKTERRQSRQPQDGGRESQEEEAGPHRRDDGRDDRGGRFAMIEGGKRRQGRQKHEKQHREAGDPVRQHRDEGPSGADTVSRQAENPHAVAADARGENLIEEDADEGQAQRLRVTELVLEPLHDPAPAQRQDRDRQQRQRIDRHQGRRIDVFETAQHRLRVGPGRQPPDAGGEHRELGRHEGDAPAAGTEARDGEPWGARRGAGHRWIAARDERHITKTAIAAVR